jgi:hypothetical protein
MNEFKIKRKKYTAKSTIGELSYNGVFLCYTLEDKVRGPKEKKVFAQTAIPAGRYQLIIDESTRFKRLMPLVVNVPGFAGVRLHGGNDCDDTEGCPLLGMEKGPDTIWNCPPAFEKLFKTLTKALTEGKVYLVIEDSAH